MNFRERPRVGHAMSLQATMMGATLAAAPSSEPVHPWKTRLAWNALAKQWVAVMLPGFVNGIAPTYRATFAEQKALDPDWGTNPLSGEPYFSADVFDQVTVETGTRQVDIPLYVSPLMPLALYNVGFDGSASRPVPDFFKRLGVTDPLKFPTAEEVLDGATLPDDKRPKGLRLLRACDFLVHQPRPALTSTVTLEAGPATGQSNVTQRLELRQANAGDRLRLFAGVAEARTPQTINPLAGDYDEQTYDEHLISTVYLLSPPGVAVGSAPDLTWQPFVRHNEFWNLQYGQPEFRPLPSDPGRVTIPPIGSGAATILINFLTAGINDAAQQALNILNAHSMAGYFWTATGGGAEAMARDTVDDAQAAGRGLNKAERAQDRARAAARARRGERLDPSFPYRGLAFPTELIFS